MSILDAIKRGDAHIVEMTRQEARDLTDTEIPDNLLEALDNAQGEADEAGKKAYVILQINGAVL